MNIWTFLLFMTLVRIILAALFPLSADESYYWLWSKHLALSYVDHPPMVAFINFLLTLGKENLFLIRLGANLIVLSISVMLYHFGQRFFNQKVAFFSALIFQILPHFLIIWLTMFVELPLALFWTAALFTLFIIIKDKRKYFWYLLGILIGLGYLSKYTMFLFWPCLALFFMLSPRNRIWLRRKEPYLAGLISLIFFIPVILWNMQNSWVSFVFHSTKATSSFFGVNFIPFIVDQLVHFSPFLLFLIIPIYRFALKKNESTKLLFCFSAPILILFLVLSLKIKVWAHWPAVGYISLIPLSLLYVTNDDMPLKRFINWNVGFTLIVLSLLLWVSPAVLPNQRNYAKNYDLIQSLPKDYKIFAQSNVTASLLEFYTQKQTYLATGFLKPGALWGEKQYELWKIPNLIPGENILYFGKDTKNFRKAAEQNFKTIIELEGLKFYLIEDYITNSYKFFQLEGYSGIPAHP